MPILGAPLDFTKYEARNLRAHILSTAPSSPVTGQMYFNSGDNTLYWWDGTQWISARGGASATPQATASTQGTIQLAGDLAGTAVVPLVANGAITDTKVAAANKDGTAAVASMRTLGSGALQAAAGNDARFTDARTPTAHKTTHEPGGSDAMSVDAVVGTGSLRTLGSGSTQAMPGNRTLDAVTAPVAAVSLNNQRITALADPTGAQDGATKNYVDNLSAGLDAKGSVHAATTANVTLAGGAPNTLDGVTLVVNDRVLVKDQTTPNQNGIYVVTTLGTGANGTWTRASDMDTWGEVPAAFTWVEQGTVNGDSGWVSTADIGGTLGTTSITWTQFTGTYQITDGVGLLKTGNVLDVRLDNSSIEAPADILQVKAGGVTNTMLAGGIDLTSKVTGALPVLNGGTGSTTAAGSRTSLGAPGYYSNNATHGAGTTITITAATHSLGAKRGIHVQVQDNSTGAVELPDISVAANGDVTITYGAALTANTKLVTLVG
ncbi:MAG: hypothetical protein ACJ8BW_21925 [Ktedonobacteraceae bacterium]|jgi:hypothetical protein